MGAQYLFNEKGQVIAVQIPIKEWELIKSKYPEVDHLSSGVTIVAEKINR